MSPAYRDLEARAGQSGGISHEAVFALVAGALAARGTSGVILDVGCGGGHLRSALGNRFSRYIGADALRYEGLPQDIEFHRVDLNGKIPLPDAHADVVAAVETIEHLENPRAFMRELVRLAKPGGWIAVTTPNQLSLISLLTLARRGVFSHFQDGEYPAHITALLEMDLRRIAAECGLTDIAVEYSGRGRVIFTSFHYPRWVVRLFPRALSTNVMLIGRKS